MSVKTGKKSKPSAQNPDSWQAQKSASTRNQIVEAAIKAFVKLGYANTTTTHIAAQAGLSRGAMLHHFPSKMDIVQAAVEFLHEKRLSAFRRSMSELPEDADRVKLAVESYWGHVRHPMFVAFFELSVAARTDKELRAILRPVQKEFAVMWYKTAEELFPEWDGKREAFDLALDLSETIMEGLAISHLTHYEPKNVERLLEYLEQCLRELLNA
ncbi:MAG: TetR/AcrR family transcriptional regulator [Woeseiaceae bacterium]|nr:TetR/AcrR family transcriptional regulator [Woeseiaceae bacterium]